MALERTLSIVKPDGLRANLIGEVYRRFEKAGLSIVAARMLHLSQREARGVDEHPHPAILENRISRLRSVGVIADVRKAGTAGLAYPKPQPPAVSTRRQEALDAIGCGFSQ